MSTTTYERDTFTWTEHYKHGTDFTSAFVREVYYDSQTRELLVGLEDANAWPEPEIKWYVYEDVPDYAASSLILSYSVGTHYNNIIKKSYGPATVLNGKPFHMEKRPARPEPAPRDAREVTDPVKSKYKVVWEYRGSEMEPFVTETEDGEAALRNFLDHVQALGMHNHTHVTSVVLDVNRSATSLL